MPSLKELKRSRTGDLKLNTLLEITNAINNNLPDHELYVLFTYILEQQLSIGKAIMFLKQDEVWTKVLDYGVNENERSTDVERTLTHVNSITVVAMEGMSEDVSFDVVIPVSHQSEIIAYLLLGDLDEQEIKTSPIIKHLPFIQTLANITAVAVENQRLIQKSIEQERLNRELEMAREMQSLLFPKKLPNNETIQIASEYMPHQQVGGDYYDVIETGDDIYICLADVSGKGMSAAILMANFQANLRAILRVESDLKTITKELNTRVWNNASGEKFITMFIARLRLKHRVIDYINAAHPSPILLQGRHVMRLQEGCVGLGMFDDIPFINQGEIKLQPGSTLFCYTDGVSELENEEEQVFSEDVLIELLRTQTKKSVSEINKKVLAALNEFKGKQTFNDDIALVSCRFG